MTARNTDDAATWQRVGPGDAWGVPPLFPVERGRKMGNHRRRRSGGAAPPVRMHSGPSRAAPRVSSSRGSAKKRPRRSRTRTWSGRFVEACQRTRTTCRPRRRCARRRGTPDRSPHRRAGAARAAARPRASARRDGQRRRDAVRVAPAVRAGQQFGRRQPVAGEMANRSALRQAKFHCGPRLLG